MKKAELERLSRRYLLPHLPGYAAKGGLLFERQPGYLLRGFYLDPSGWDTSAFYAGVFVQPLYVPSTYIVLTFGKRLRSGTTTWHVDKGRELEAMSGVLAYIRKEGLPFLQMLQSPSDLANRAARITNAPDDVHVMEAVGYSLILSERYREAFEALSRLQEIAAEILSQPDHPDWLHYVAERSQRVQDALARDPQEAVTLLNRTRDETLRSLRLMDDKPKRAGS